MLMDLGIKGGSVHFEADGPMTIEDIVDLTRAGDIAGIPLTAVITQISFNWDGERAQILIGWNLPK